MTIEKKIQELNEEIQNYIWTNDGVPYYPLPDKIKELKTIGEVLVENDDDSKMRYEFLKQDIDRLFIDFENEGFLTGKLACNKQCVINGAKKLSEKFINFFENYNRTHIRNTMFNLEYNEDFTTL